MIRNIRILATFALLSVLTADLRAERKYVIGSGVSFVAGGSTSAAVSGLGFEQLSSGLSPFYSSYPSIDIKSTGRNSVFDVSYTFGLYRLQSDVDIDSKSQSLSANLSSRLGEKWKLKLSESFEAAPDFTTSSVFRGLIPSPQGFEYVFDPVALRRSSISHRFNGNLNYDLNPKAGLSFGLSHSLRDYEEDPSFRGRLTDQNRIEGNIGFDRKIDKYRGWSLKYAVFRNAFRDRSDAITHDSSVGYSHQLTPSVRLSFDLGPSYTRSLSFNRSYLGYNASLNLLRSIRSNRLALKYKRRVADSIGLGYVSDIHSAGVGIVLPIKRKTTFTFDVSAFDSTQRLHEDPLAEDFKSKGILGFADLSFALSEDWSLSAGASYQQHAGVSLMDIEQRRVFIALRFRAPELWRFAK